MEPGPWRLFTLTRVELCDPDDVPVSGPTRFALAVLALLVLEDRKAWNRADLSQEVWPNSRASDARASLRAALSMLRKALPEGALETVGEAIRLKRNVVWCDASATAGYQDDDLDFFPGVESEWAERHRNRLRSQASINALAAADEAWECQETERATKLAQRAYELDPTSRETKQRLTRFAEATGASVTAVVSTLVSPEPGSKSGEHPLVQAVLWLLQSNPSDALEMLANTQAHWLTELQLSEAVEVHRRVLEANPRSSTARTVVESFYMFMQTLWRPSPDTNERIRDSYRRTNVGADRGLAVRLASTLAFSHLALGNLGMARRVSETLEGIAEPAGSPSLEDRARLNAAIVRLALGDTEIARQKFLTSLRSAQDLSSVEEAAFVLLHLAMLEAHEGRIDASLGYLDACRPALTKSPRLRTWLGMTEFKLLAESGHPDQAAEALTEVQRNGSFWGELDALCASEYELARILCKLGEYRKSAEAWSRARALRREHPIGPNLFERGFLQEARPILKEKLGEDELRKLLSP